MTKDDRCQFVETLLLDVLTSYEQVKQQSEWFLQAVLIAGLTASPTVCRALEVPTGLTWTSGTGTGVSIDLIGSLALDSEGGASAPKAAIELKVDSGFGGMSGLASHQLLKYPAQFQTEYSSVPDLIVLVPARRSGLLADEWNGIEAGRWYGSDYSEMKDEVDRSKQYWREVNYGEVMRALSESTSSAVGRYSPDEYAHLVAAVFSSYRQDATVSCNSRPVPDAADFEKHLQDAIKLPQ